MNHTPQEVGKKHYEVYGRQKEKRIALERWSTSLAGILVNETDNANVVPIKQIAAQG